MRHEGVDFTVDLSGEVAVSIALGASCAIRCRTSRGVTDAVPHLGSFGVLAPGEPLTVSVRGASAFLQVRFPSDVLSRWLAEDLGLVSAAQVFATSGAAIDDPVVAAFAVRAMVAGVEGEEEMLRSLAVRLAQRHAAARPATAGLRRGGLTGPQLRRVADRVLDGLSGPLPLGVLAREAGLSPFHFAREFARRVGRTPHQYVTERRLSQAVADLTRTSLPVDAVAARVGFSHASHLSRHMKRVFGCTPAEFRRSILL